jgi:hypothetical protein
VRRSGAVFTPVTVTKPILGSFSSPIASARTARTDSFTRRIRSAIERHHLALDAGALEFLPVQKALGVVEQAFHLTVPARDAGDGDSRPLPELVVVDLGHRRPETMLELRLDGLHILPLAL